MITEDYVSFETAKLLKEKGFDELCCPWYSPYGDFNENGLKMRNSDCALETIMAPTLQMVMKWLRKVHNLHIEVRYFPTPKIYRYVILRSPMTIENIDSHPQYFNSYEEACEAAIKYCLENLI
jgi:hypothetical protein